MCTWCKKGRDTEVTCCEGLVVVAGGEVVADAQHGPVNRSKLQETPDQGRVTGQTFLNGEGWGEIGIKGGADSMIQQEAVMLGEGGDLPKQN